MPPGANRSVGAEPNSRVCHNFSPSLRLKHRTWSRSLSRPSEAVRKMRSSHTTGALTPAPGSGFFHTTFLVLDQVSGKSFSAEMPRLPGPRQPGQLSARAGLTLRSNATRELIETRMRQSPGSFQEVL